MNKAELIEIAATGADVSKAAAGKVLDSIIAAVVKAVGDAPGCAYSVALKPGKILDGKAILNFL